MGLIMEQSDRKEALRWYEAAAAQGYPAAIERLEQLRASPCGAEPCPTQARPRLWPRRCRRVVHG